MCFSFVDSLRCDTDGQSCSSVFHCDLLYSWWYRFALRWQNENNRTYWRRWMNFLKTDLQHLKATTKIQFFLDASVSRSLKRVFFLVNSVWLVATQTTTTSVPVNFTWFLSHLVTKETYYKNKKINREDSIENIFCHTDHSLAWRCCRTVIDHKHSTSRAHFFQRRAGAKSACCQISR